MRFAASLLALLIGLFAAVPGAAAADDDPKVVLIVGPVAEATQRYRDRAEAAAKVADRYTSNVIRLYSPNATWPAVKRALDGAAVVVYLGHGNGWPSRYRDSLYGATQNGFGLNPVAGGGDEAYQYFGEDRIAAEVRLAKNAVVLLHHLCYASGNTEPGLPEGTVDQAKQRVANYAAGFIRAGAGAVVAEGNMGPAWYMEQLFRGNRSIDAIWRAAPTVRGNEFRFESARSPGFVAAMDPDRRNSGFYRSIVYRGGVGAGRLEPAQGASAPLPDPEPTLVGSGLDLGTPYLKAPPVAGAASRLWFPYTTKNRDDLDGLTVGVRWDPIDVAADPAPEEGAGSSPRATDEPLEAAPEPAPTIEVSPSEDGVSPPRDDGAAASASPEPDAAAPARPPAADPSAARLTYIQPGQVGDVVEPVAALVGPTRVVVDVTLPSRPGRYRLVITLHDKGKVAYDAATQELVGSVIVDVAGALDARFLVEPTARVGAGQRLELPVGVANVGAKAWTAIGADRRRGPEEQQIAALLVAHWVALDPGGEAPARSSAVRLAESVDSGVVERVLLGLDAPERPGSYLLVLDVLVPSLGSLTGNGGQPAMVRVLVE